MITPKDYEVLYYKTPHDYRGKLDAQTDPNHYDNMGKKYILKDLLLKCSANVYIQTIINLFKDKYPNIDYLHTISTDWSDPDINIKIKKPLREDLKEINFGFIENVEDDFGGLDEFLDNLLITFKTVQSQLSRIVEMGLHGKKYSKTSEGNKDTFTVEESPILQVITTDHTVQLFLDKNSYIDYCDI